MNPSTASPVVVREIKKTLEHPITGKEFARKATIEYPTVPNDPAALIAYFGGDAQAIANAVTFAINAKLSVAYSARLKGGKGLASLLKAKKALADAGMTPDAIELMIQSNPVLAANLDMSDISEAYTAAEIADFFKSDSEPEPDADEKPAAE